MLFVIALLMVHSCALAAAQARGDGQYQAAVMGGAAIGNIYISSDGGAHWNKALAPQRFWTRVAVSASGQCQAAIAWAGPTTGPYAVWFSFTFGGVWQEVLSVPDTKLYGLTLSSSGNSLVVTAANGTIFSSNNYGRTWDVVATLPVPNGYLYSIGGSASGQFLTATVQYGSVFRSQDYGLSWNVTTAPTGIKWTTVSVSAQGRFQTLLGNGDFVYVSTNYGQTWQQSGVNPGWQYWQEAGACGTGKYQTAACSRCGIWISDNFGANFTVVNSTGVPTDNWNAVALSYTGKLQILGASTAFSNPGLVYTSSDYGHSWTPAALPASTWHVAMNQLSADADAPLVNVD